jgi:hypothetical protein
VSSSGPSWLVARLATWAERTTVHVGVAGDARRRGLIARQHGGRRAGPPGRRFMTRGACGDVPPREERTQQLCATVCIARNRERVGRVAALAVGPELAGVRVLVTTRALRADTGQPLGCPCPPGNVCVATA